MHGTYLAASKPLRDDKKYNFYSVGFIYQTYTTKKRRLN